MKIKAAKAELEAEAAAARARKRAQQAEEAQEKAKAEAEEAGKREDAAAKHAKESAERSRKAAEQAKQAAKKAGMDEPNLQLRREDEFPSHQVPSTPEGKPKPKAQRNFTDPDSRIMKKGKDGYMQGYNAQAVVDDACQIIIAADVTNQAPDAEHFVPMLKLAISNCGAVPQIGTFDAGYWSEANEKAAIKMGIDPYIATGRLRRGEVAPAPAGRIPNDLDAKGRMRRKLNTKKGKAIYARRKAIVEPVFGQVKEPRGLRQFLLRGIKKVRGEFSLIAMTHNILKLWRSSIVPT